MTRPRGVKAVDIACPACGAAAGELCVRRLQSGRSRPADYSHADRLKAALATVQPPAKAGAGGNRQKPEDRRRSEASSGVRTARKKAGSRKT